MVIFIVISNLPPSCVAIGGGRESKEAHMFVEDKSFVPISANLGLSTVIQCMRSCMNSDGCTWFAFDDEKEVCSLYTGSNITLVEVTAMGVKNYNMTGKYNNSVIQFFHRYH